MCQSHFRVKEEEATISVLTSQAEAIPVISSQLLKVKAVGRYEGGVPWSTSTDLYSLKAAGTGSDRRLR